jgi:hypothetical protein
MVYNSKFLHFMVRGRVGQYFQRAGGRPAGARTEHPAVLGSTEMPRHHVLAVHLASSSRPEDTSILARSLAMSADSFSRSLRTFYIG